MIFCEATTFPIAYLQSIDGRAERSYGEVETIFWTVSMLRKALSGPTFVEDIDFSCYWARPTDLRTDQQIPFAM